VSATIKKLHQPAFLCQIGSADGLNEDSELVLAAKIVIVLKLQTTGPYHFVVDIKTQESREIDVTSVLHFSAVFQIP